MELEDREKIWQNEWFPSTSARISAFFQYFGEGGRLDVKDFEIDLLEFSFDNGGDKFTIGAQQTPFSKNLREKRSQEYENITLSDLITLIATRQGLTSIGSVFAITFKRITQNEESDLEFLTRLSEDYGHLFKIQGNQIINYLWQDLDEQPADFTLTRKEITSFSATKKLSGIYKGVNLVYFVGGDQAIGAFIKAERENNSSDILVINERAESLSEAQAKAKEKLRKANAEEWSGDLVVEGEFWQIAGINFNIKGFGRFDGVWQIQEIDHSFSSDGWVASMKIFRIRE